MQSYDEDPISLFNSQDLVRTTTTLQDHPNRRQLNQYICGEKIGKGKHGDVYLCKDEASGYELVCSSFILLAFVSTVLFRQSKLLNELILAIK
jgi:hypothetical protein